jgi:hypothetical protein
MGDSRPRAGARQRVVVPVTLGVARIFLRSEAVRARDEPRMGIAQTDTLAKEHSMQRRLAALFLLPLLLATAAYAWARLAGPRVYVNGVPLREAALVKEGVTYVPLRAVAEALNCPVSYDPKAGVQIWSNLPQAPRPPEITLPGGVPLPSPAIPHPEPVLPTAPQVPGR